MPHNDIPYHAISYHITHSHFKFTQTSDTECAVTIDSKKVAAAAAVAVAAMPLLLVRLLAYPLAGSRSQSLREVIFLRVMRHRRLSNQRQYSNSDYEIFAMDYLNYHLT
jgi:hypothetical protein